MQDEPEPGGPRPRSAMPPPVETAEEARDRPPRGSGRLVWLAVLVTLALAAVLTYACTQRVPVDGAASTVRATE